MYSNIMVFGLRHTQCHTHMRDLRIEIDRLLPADGQLHGYWLVTSLYSNL